MQAQHPGHSVYSSLHCSACGYSGLSSLRRGGGGPRRYNDVLATKAEAAWPAKSRGKPWQKAMDTGLFLGLVLPARVGWVSEMLQAAS